MLTHKSKAKGICEALINNLSVSDRNALSIRRFTTEKHEWSRKYADLPDCRSMLIHFEFIGNIYRISTSNSTVIASSSMVFIFRLLL